MPVYEATFTVTRTIDVLGGTPKEAEWAARRQLQSTFGARLVSVIPKEEPKAPTVDVGPPGG